MPPQDPHDFPRCYPWSRWIGYLLLRAQGWKPVGGPPNTHKAILIATPHTSNWDFWFALLAGWSWGLSFQWLGKDKLFEGPLGPLLRFLGGVGVDRSKPNGFVDQVGEQFEAADRMLLMVPAAGTRSYRDHWKSGFYWMALRADVPVILGFLDYGRKEAGLGTAMRMTGDVKADMDQIRAFYKGKQGKYPDKVSRIRLQSEPEDASDAP